ncbi:MAG: NAD(P)H-dependent glycerol-3-phosphate dehydrogenase [Beijerinckiaceae bacterium]|nr:NAD(P)H-dependent glycerol-3-phosphate dehydrogenase [Beijerinckiaceae bacterium]
MTEPVFAKIGVVGAGAWGTALANVAARAGRDVVLWARDPAQAAHMVSTGANAKRLPGVAIEAGVTPTSDLSALTFVDAILLVAPAQSTRAVAAELARTLAPGVPLVICAKGVERGTHAFLSDAVREAATGHPVASLSGPSFADDVARGLPTAVTIAAEDETLARTLGAALATNTFRLYHSTDLRGVEIGGAAKNVLAIACGVATGIGLGASAQAALVARGFAELLRFARAWGGRDETLMGLSGLGDLVLTCGSLQSRNFALGHALGRGEPAPAKLAEGAFTASALVEMARERDVEMPIAEAVAAVLEGSLTAKEAVVSLLARPPKSEA